MFCTVCHLYQQGKNVLRRNYMGYLMVILGIVIRVILIVIGAELMGIADYEIATILDIISNVL